MCLSYLKEYLISASVSNYIISALRNTQCSGCSYDNQETLKGTVQIREKQEDNQLNIPGKIVNKLYIKNQVHLLKNILALTVLPTSRGKNGPFPNTIVYWVIMQIALSLMTTLASVI